MISLIDKPELTDGRTPFSKKVGVLDIFQWDQEITNRATLPAFLGSSTRFCAS